MISRKPTPSFILVIAFTILFALASLLVPALFAPIDVKLYDAAMVLTPSGRGSERAVVLVEIDQGSIKALGAWPWPRQILGDMLTLLSKQGAKVVGLHIPLGEKESNRWLKELRVFKEKFDAYSFSKKDESMRDWILEGLREVEENLDSDRLLVERVKQARNVVLPLFIGDPGRENAPDPVTERVLQRNAITDGRVRLSRNDGPERTRFLFPFVELSDAALGLGHSGLSARPGMEGRSHPLFIQIKDGLLPSFPLRAGLAFLGRNPNQVIAEPSRLKIQDFSVPLWEGEMLVPFRRGVELNRHSFADVLKGGKGSSIEGKVVLIGFNQEDAKKIATPTTPAMPVVEFYGHIIDAIFSKDFIRRPSTMIYFEAAAVAAIGFITAFLLLGVSHRVRLGSGLALLFFVLAIEYFLFTQGLWVKSGAVALFIVILVLALTLAGLFERGGRSEQAMETNRLLGIGFQREGLLDQAFAEFRQLYLDRETKELIYQLGLEYERKSMTNKALDVYEYLNRHDDYRDVPERIRKLRETQPGPAPAEGAEEGQAAATAVQQRTRVGRYEIIQELGKGSMGLVYKAMDPMLNRLLAVKTIRFSDEFDPEVIQEIKERFFREAEIAGRLSHPGIVTIYDVGEDQELTYMAMELLEGEDLEKHITPETLLPLRELLEVVASVADALDFAHKSGVIHRDIKPANIMLMKQGGVKVTDFGIAKAMSSSRTRTGIILGTPNYMSPEQIMGQRIDYRSDIFSLGVLFYQALTGELPFRADNLSSLLHQITQVKQVPVRERNPRIPKVCEQLVDKALAKNPNHRFTSAGEMCKLTRLVISKMDQLRRK